MNKREGVIKHLESLGVIPTGENSLREYNIGGSDYAKKAIQPWSIWIEYDLDPWRADIVKRILRTKEGDDPILDLQKIQHICDELIRQEEVKKGGD